MIKEGDKIFVRDAYIENDYMVYQGEVLAIGYYKNTTSPIVYLIQWGIKSHWIPSIGVKKE